MPNTTKSNQSEIARIEIVISNLYTMLMDAETTEERAYCNDAIENYENTLAQLVETAYYHCDDPSADAFENVREESNWADWPE